MKSLILSMVLILCVSFAFAQNKDVLEETITTTKKVKTNEGEKQLQEQVLVRQEQDINLSEEDKNKINQDIVSSPVKVTKKETIINGKTVLNNDTSFTCEGVECNFAPSETGFIIGDNDDALKATTYKSSNNDFIVETSKGNGIGYFDSNANFVIEYFDKEQNKIVKRVYTSQ